MPRNRGYRKDATKKGYVAKKRRMRKEAKESTVKDDAQDFTIKKLDKKVTELTKATKAYAVASSGSANIPTIFGLTGSTVLSSFTVPAQFSPSSINSANVKGAFPQGDYFTIKHIGLNYQIDTDPISDMDDNGTSIICRVMLLCIHQMMGQPGDQSGSVLPNLNDILEVPDVALTSADMLSHYSRLQRSNFEVLYDEIHTLIPNINSFGAGAQAGTDRPFVPVRRINVSPQKRSQRVVLNNPGSATVVDTAQNLYILLAFCDSVDTVDLPTLTFNWVTDFLE